MEQSVGLVFSSLLFEMLSVYSDSQISLLQTYADQIFILWGACRPSGLFLAGEQQVAGKLFIAREG